MLICSRILGVTRAHDALSKLWHYRLGHISRGRIERKVKNDILPPLELSDLEQCRECIKGKFVKTCRECIKGKYVKKINKDAKRSEGIL